MKFRLLYIAYFTLIFLDLVLYQDYIDPNYEKTSRNPSRYEEVQIFPEPNNSLYLEQWQLIHF